MCVRLLQCCRERLLQLDQTLAVEAEEIELGRGEGVII